MVFLMNIVIDSSTVQTKIAIAKVTAQVAALESTGAKFASVTYTNKEGETARHTILLGYNYGRVLKSSLKAVSKRRPVDALKQKALANVIASLNKSIEANSKGTVSEDYTCKDVYETICNGIMVHKETGVFYIKGLSIAKVVLVKGVPTADTRRDLTKAQDEIKKSLPISKIRQYSLTAEQMELVRIGGRHIQF